MKRTAIIILKFALLLGILIFLFRKAIQDDQFENFATVDKHWYWLVIALVACAAANFISVVRWRMLVRILGLPFSLLDAIRIGMIGMCFSFVAFGAVGGDSMRAFYVAREAKNKTHEAIASVIVDRMIGVLSMSLIASIVFLCVDFSDGNALYPKKLAIVRYICVFALAVSGVGFLGFFGLLFTPRLESRAWFGLFARLPKVGPVLKRLTEEIRVYRGHVPTLLFAFVLSVGVNFCFAISIFAVAAGITRSHPTFAQHLLIEPISMLANGAPLPGGIGGMELTLDFLYEGFTDQNNPNSQGVVVAFGFRATLLLISALGAFVWFFNRDVTRRWGTMAIANEKPRNNGQAR